MPKILLPAAALAALSFTSLTRPVAPLAIDLATEIPLIEIDGRFRRLGFARKEAS